MTWLSNLAATLGATAVTVVFLGAVVLIWQSAKRQLRTARIASNRPLFIDCLHWGLLGVSVPFTIFTVVIWFLRIPQDPTGWAQPGAKAMVIMGAAIAIGLLLIVDSTRRTDHRRAFGRTAAVSVLLLGVSAGVFVPYLNYRVPSPTPTTLPTSR